MPGRVCRHYLGSATTRAEGTDRHMEPDQEDRPAGPACLRETQPRETRLRDEWSRRSLATGWRMPDDWESEAVDEVLAETIDDLVALFAVLGGDGGQSAGALAGSGGERVSVLSSQFARGGCEDPLSGMATLPYLRTRLAELYREA